MNFYSSKKLFFRGLAAFALVLTTCPSGVASSPVSLAGHDDGDFTDPAAVLALLFNRMNNVGQDHEHADDSDDSSYLYFDDRDGNDQDNGGDDATVSSHSDYDGEHIDECGEVCAAFTAENRGNGYDLCGNSTSHCHYSVSRGQHLCSSLFWQLLDDGSGNRGVVFEANESTLTADNDPLTCDEANEILHEGAEYSGQDYNDYDNNDRWIDNERPERPITHHLNTALQLFIHSSPIARRLASRHIWDNREFMYHLAQYANNANTTDIIRLWLPVPELGSVIGALTQLAVASDSINSFVSRFNSVGHTACPYCNSMDREESVMASLLVNITGAVNLQDALPRGLVYELRVTPGCYDCGTRIAPENVTTLSLIQSAEVLALRLHQASNSTPISVPQVLDISAIPGAQNVPNTRYRLYAIVSGDDISSETIMRINDQWFRSINGTNLTLTDSPFDEIGESIVRNTVNLVLYEQM